MTENQLKLIQQLENYARRMREKHFYDKEQSERSAEDIEIKEICTNVLTWCILIKGNN